MKWNANAPAGMFEAEADGLEALRNASGLRIPEVLGFGTEASGPSWLLLEYVPAGGPGERFCSRLAEGLARLHRLVDGAFGWGRDNFIGSLPQANGWDEDWAAFWWERRLEPKLRMARDRGFLSGEDDSWRRLERGMSAILEDAPADRTSMLHGDLWSGNVYPSADGEPVVIDPAVYRGHAEVDLAMTELFGGFAPDFHDAYAGATSLSPMYDEGRRDLYQLYPLLVHVNLFGGSYEGGVRAALARALRLV